MRLSYREPYRFKDLLAFLKARSLGGVEVVDDDSYARTVRIKDPDGAEARGWLRVEDDPTESALIVTLSPTLESVTDAVADRLRCLFDLDSDPATIADGLAPLAVSVPEAPIEGVRLPGCFDPFETICRAVLGQQISVKAANRLAARIAQTYGDPIETHIAGLDRLWPTPAQLLALHPLEATLGRLGVVGTRSRVIAALARMAEADELTVSEENPAASVIERLLAVKGIGPWTANYIAMRALGFTDAFLETDAGIVHALPDLTPRERLALVEPCRPWRSYAVIALWNSLSV